MNYNNISNLIMDNIKKLVFPEEWLNLDLAFSKQELFAMIIVQQQGEIIMSQIADYVHVPMSTATGIVNRLVKSGHMLRTRSEADRRIVVIRLTAKGKALVAEIIKTASEYVKLIADELTEEERETLYSILLKIIKVLNEKKPGMFADEGAEPNLKKIEIE